MLKISVLQHTCWPNVMCHWCTPPPLTLHVLYQDKLNITTGLALLTLIIQLWQYNFSIIIIHNYSCLFSLLLFSVISELLTTLRNNIGCLYKLSECVSMLDLLLSLAHVCTISDYGEFIFQNQSISKSWDVWFSLLNLFLLYHHKFDLSLLILWQSNKHFIQYLKS